MAITYLSINRGQLDGQTGNVLVASSLPTADIIFAIDFTNLPTVKDTTLAMEAFEHYIESNGIPAPVANVLPIL